MDKKNVVSVSYEENSPNEEEAKHSFGGGK